MIWIDYTLMGLVFISAIIGLLRGLVHEGLSLVVWGMSVWVGLTFSRGLASFLAIENIVPYPSMRIGIAFAILFFMALIAGVIINKLLGELIKRTGLTGTDRFLGMLFGVARGVLVVALLVVLGGLTPLPEDLWWQDSKLIPPFQSVAMWLRDNMPNGLTGYLDYSK